MSSYEEMRALSRALLPVGYGASWHRVLIDQALTGLPAALLVEVRWSSRSRLPGWGGTALRRRYGERYLNLGFLLGNSAYREPGQIQIRALSQGVEVLLRLMEQGHTPLLLLCGCAEYLRCHRRQICEAVQAADPSVTLWQPEQVLPWLASLPRQEGPHTCSV